MKTRTLIVTDDKVKQLFKAECFKNNTEMSKVTEAMWKQYILQSIKARKDRAEVKIQDKEIKPDGGS